MERVILEKKNHINYLNDQLNKTKELPQDMMRIKQDILERIQVDAKHIMKTISQIKVTLPESYEKRAQVIFAAQKLISASDQDNQPTNLTIMDPIVKEEATGDLPPIEKERAGENKRSDSDNKTKRPKSVPKQPVHQTIYSLLEDEEISKDSEDLQSKEVPYKLPGLLLANTAHGAEKNLCFVNAKIQLLRHIPTFR